MAGLADVLIGNPDDATRVPTLRQGVVTQASPLLVRVGSATTATAARALSGYAPHVDDVVSVLVVEGDRLVLGQASTTSQAGIVAVGSFTFGENTLFTDQAMVTSTISAATVVNRWYRATIDIRALRANVSCAVTFQLLIDGNWSNDRWLQIIGTDLGFAPGFTNFHGEWVFAGDGATHTYGVRYSGPDQNIWGYASGGHFYVECIG